jgi:predicted Rossmann fold nucleotide-binding protein DprA/Smf involved in DNA uptake
MTNQDRVKKFIINAHNVPFTLDQIAAGTGLTSDQVKRSLRDVKVAGMGKRYDGRYQVKGRKVQ